MSSIISGYVIYTHTNQGYYTHDVEFADDIRVAKIYPTIADAYAEITDPNLFVIFVDQACLIHEYHKVIN
jgi:hypothetical protein